MAAKAPNNRPDRVGWVEVADIFTRKLALEKGAVLTTAESRHVLLLYARAVIDGPSPCAAKTTSCVGLTWYITAKSTRWC